ncbi:hypothetical protein IC235_07060 [Hymenobacter sp. BT664]|uniref:Gingipain domain-containing protein n=1 Tax=Hymenobacter montanus TaxID=2771359 RepID=A0A927GIN8_9BACT|nr:C25 family cysteine peptidase [Hymenobacter montanus]MBD2767648.1 hypothetical protein [Hymenobacter montanus]
MNWNFKQRNVFWGLWLLLLGVSTSAAVAQSGPVGNEWIVPGQPYYKVKILKDGLYKIDYQYLTQAGITGVAPSQLQIWRRGREIATYLGGNSTTLDPTTFLEFYALRNDGKLDVELYKQPQDQPHPYYNFYTDTASYFITWSTTGERPGRRMAQPNAAGGAVHPHRLTNQLFLKVGVYVDRPKDPYTYLPWVEPAEGYFEDKTRTTIGDTAVRNVVTTGPPPQVEVMMFGVTDAEHLAEVLVQTPAGADRSLGTIRWSGRSRGRKSFALLASDVDPNGKVVIKTRRYDSDGPRYSDEFYSCYVRIGGPQLSTWYPNRNSILFQNDSLLTGPATYEFDASSIPATVVGFDVQDFYNVQRVVSTVGSTGTNRRFVFPDANASATHNLLLANEARLPVPPVRAQRVYFRNIDPAVPNFIIITHPQLMQRDPATGMVNAPKLYAAYRASAAGGRYDTLVVTVSQLYDQFMYGDRSWLAMRHFGRWLAAATPGATNRYLLLIGKGIVPSERGTYYRAGGELGQNLVLCSSRAASDNMLTADWQANRFDAQLNTGRLTVLTPAQVLAYLAKVREYDALGDQPWRKNVLHLIGGTDPDEFVEYRGYMNQYKQSIEKPLFGGQVSTVERTTIGGTGSSVVVRTNIASYLNPGLGLISYFGHASPTAFSLEIGDVNDPGNGYNNTNGKYPVMMYRGCSAGALYTSDNTTFFEKWLFAPGKGAIGALGETGFAFAGYLNVSQDTLTRLLFNDPAWYGKPVTAVYNEMVRRLQRAPGGLFNNPDDGPAAEMLLSTTWHGDPTVSLYAPPKPDFQVSDAALAISPLAPATAVTAASPEFVLKIGVTNPGKVTTDSVEIRVTRTIPGQPNTVSTKHFAQGPQGSATYDFRLTNPAGINVFGTNTFRVELDYRNKVDESNETNNTASTSFTFLRGGVTVLNPVEFAIVGTNQPQLVAQTNDPTGQARLYEFEVDTTAAFNSGQRRQSGPITATIAPRWRPTLPAFGPDSVVWYWRVRFQSPAPDEDPNWVVSSFRVIPGRTAGGWSQSHYTQFRRNQRQGVEVAAPTGQWSFSTENKPLLLRTAGGGLPGAPPSFEGGVGFGVTTNVQAPPTVANCGVRAPNMLVAVYDQRTLETKTGLPGAAVCSQPPQEFYIFGSNPANAADTTNTLNNNAARQAQLATFLATVPDGDYVAIVSMNRLRWPSLTTVKTALSTLLGSQLVNQLRNGDPFLLVAQKRASGGRLLHEAGPDLASPTIPRYNQTITLKDTLRTPSSRGVITSARIGPASSWENLHHWIQREPGATSNYTLKVIGIDTLNQSTVLPITITAASPQQGGYSLSSISAAQYPYLQLELTMEDRARRVAPQLKEWFITYQGVPEGVVLKDQAPSSAYEAATLTAQASDARTLTIPVVFENVTPYDFGTPLRARIELRDAQGVVRASGVVNAPGQLRGDSRMTIPVTLAVGNNFGTNFTTKVTINPRPRALPEVNLFNNELNLGPFPIIDKNVPPTLDVAFDGRHILNGELVSSTPVINIQLKDEDRITPITDRSAFTVTLLKPGQTGLPTLVDLNGSDVNFNVEVNNGSVAKLEYRPGQRAPLPDGVYTLRVQGRDPRQASAGAQEFQVKFEVVNASTISNLYPYPNPVTNKARFVFTLTGQQLPRNMKIQILTLTGRVVREIFMSELGPLHIGNNITDFAWDGTDSYGDRLANGTYLYRVSLDDAEGQFSRRDTAGDQAFKKDWGKLVLMR